MRWTKEEIGYLKEIYPNKVHIDLIKEKLNKSRRAIQHKAARLGLSRPYTPFNKPKNPQHRNIIDKRYYEKHKREIYRRKKERKREMKEGLVKMIGGKCSACGYHKCLAALEFHHQSGDKDSTIKKALQHYSKQKTLKEVKKCILLCANCHRELHNQGV